MKDLGRGLTWFRMIERGLGGGMGGFSEDFARCWRLREDVGGRIKKTERGVEGFGRIWKDLGRGCTRIEKGIYQVLEGSGRIPQDPRGGFRRI